MEVECPSDGRGAHRCLFGDVSDRELLDEVRVTQPVTVDTSRWRTSRPATNLDTGTDKCTLHGADAHPKIDTDPYNPNALGGRVMGCLFAPHDRNSSPELWWSSDLRRGAKCVSAIRRSRTR